MDSTKWKIRLAILAVWFWLHFGEIATKAVPNSVGNLPPANIAVMPGYQINDNDEQDIADSSEENLPRSDMEKRNEPNIFKSKRNGNSSNHLEPGIVQENGDHHGHSIEENEENGQHSQTGSLVAAESVPRNSDTHVSRSENLEAGQVPGESRQPSEQDPVEGGENPVDSNGRGQNVGQNVHGSQSHNLEQDGHRSEEQNSELGIPRNEDQQGGHGNEEHNLESDVSDNEGESLQQGAHVEENPNVNHGTAHSSVGQSEPRGQENSNDGNQNNQQSPGEIPIITDTHADEQLGPGSRDNIHESIQTGEADNSHNPHNNRNGNLAPGELPLIPGDSGNHNEHVRPGFQGNNHEQGEPGGITSRPQGERNENENGHRHPDEIPDVPGFNIHDGGQAVPTEDSGHNDHHDNISEPEPNPHQSPSSVSGIPPFQGHDSEAEATSPRPSTKPPPTEQIVHSIVVPATWRTESAAQITPSASQAAMLDQGQTIQEQITESGPTLFSSYSGELDNSMHSSAVLQQQLATAGYNIGHSRLIGQSHHTEVNQSPYPEHATMDHLNTLPTISPSSTLTSESSSSTKEIKVPYKVKKSSTASSSEALTSVSVGATSSVHITGISPSVVSVEPTQLNMLSPSTVVAHAASRTVTSGHSSSSHTVGNGSGLTTTLRPHSFSREVTTTSMSQPSIPESQASTTTSQPIPGPVVSLPSVSHEIVIHENTTVTLATTKKMKKNITIAPTVSFLTTILQRTTVSSVRTVVGNFTLTNIINQTVNLNCPSTPSTREPLIKTTKMRITTPRVPTSVTTSRSTLHDNDSRLHPTLVTSPASQTNTSIPGTTRSTMVGNSTRPAHVTVPSSASTPRQNISRVTTPSVITPRGTDLTSAETRPRQTTPRDMSPRGTTPRHETSRGTTVNINLSTPNVNISGETTKQMTSIKTSILPEVITSAPRHVTSPSASTSQQTSSLRPPLTSRTPPTQNSPPPPSPPPQSPALPSSPHPPTSIVTHKWNPTPMHHPPVFATVQLRMTWDDFCDNEHNFRLELVHIFHRHAQRDVKTRQIVFVNINLPDCVDVLSPASLVEHISIKMYLVDSWGRYDITLTIDCCKVIEIGFSANKQSYFRDKLVDVKLNSPIEMVTASVEGEGLVMEPGIIIAIVIASVGGLCCITLIMLQIIIRRRYAKTAQSCPPSSRHCSFTSTDSIALGSVSKARPHSGLFNPALDLAALIEPSVPMNLTSLANKCLDVISLHEEFQTIPNYTPQLSTVPVGAEDKNRYANVIPIPHTRVKLKKLDGQPASDYINANYITGYMDDKRAYIATQAPMTHTTHDFWRMVWEQQSRVIVMLTAMDEQGHPKCAPYWPYSETDPLKRHSDFVIMLKKKDIYQEYTISTLELKHIEMNLVREVKHFWYTCWPVHGTPEPISLVKFVLDTRPYYEDSGAPLIVHCSPGTGRTGTLIALDVCMRQLENKRMVDVVGCVHQMRQERAGVIQTKEQYALIYTALNEYACVLTTPCISAASSSATLQTLH